MADTRQDDPKYKGRKGLQNEWKHIRSDYADIARKGFQNEAPDICVAVSALVIGAIGLPIAYSVEHNSTTEYKVIEQADAVPFSLEGERGYVAYSSNGGQSGTVIIKDDDGEYEVYGYGTTSVGDQRVHMTLIEDEEAAWQRMRSISAHYHQLFQSGQDINVAPPEGQFDLVDLGQVSAPAKDSRDRIIRLADSVSVVDVENMMQHSNEQAQSLLAASQTIFTGEDYGLDAQEFAQESTDITTVEIPSNYSFTIIGGMLMGSLFTLGGGVFAARSTAEVIGRSRRRRKERALKK